MKRVIQKFVLLILMSAILVQPLTVIPANAATNLVYLYETKETKTITSGLTYERKLKLTNLGWVDIHVLKMELENQNVDFDVIRSSDTWGKKSTLTSIMSENSSIAAINASFFDTATNPSDIIGVEYNDGDFAYIQENYNKTTLGAASMMVSGSEITFSYLSGNIEVKNKDGKTIYITAINGMNDFVNSVIINRNAMEDSSQIEGKAKLYKIVVENGVVTDIVAPKTIAKIPEEGYIITINENIKDKILPYYQPGTEVSLKVSTNFGDKLFDTILSGGGTILKNGQVVQEGMIVQPTKRHPRTAIGITADGKYLISMVVDGRGTSIGATHNELANYLLEYKAYNAIHMDGGGSSTLAARDGQSNAIQVENTPSEGSQRKIVNGLGFKSTAPEGTLNKLEIIAPSDRVFKNSPITFRVAGYDEYSNPVILDNDEIAWSSDGIKGTWADSTFTPTSGGEGTITCYYDNISTSIKLISSDQYIDLNIEPKVLYLNAGDTGSYKVVGTDMEGYQGNIDLKDVKWQIDDKALGSFNNGIFIAGNGSGIGRITATIDGVTLDATVVVGSDNEIKSSFESTEVTTLTYPETAKGEAEQTSETTYDGENGIKLSYDLPVSEVTQAVYAVFSDISIMSNAEKSLKLNVYGNKSYMLLKGKLVDANNNTYNITFSNGIDFNGWKELEAPLPEGMAYPVKLERIYVAALKVYEPLKGEIYFDQLTVDKVALVSSNKIEGIDLPINDPMYLSQANDYDYKVSVVGATSGANRLLDKIVQNDFIEMVNKADLAIFAGNTAVDTRLITTESLLWNNNYKNKDYEDLKVITIGTNSGGIIDTDYTQWTKLQTDLKNTVQNNIVIIGNRNPINNFEDEREGETLHTILKDYQKLTGKTIYYVNASGYDFGINYFEGIRYIDINGLWYTTNGKTMDLNNTFYLLNFYMVSGKLYYDYENVYPLVQIK